MARTSALFLFAIAAGAHAQSAWEKPIAPGLVYRMEVDLKTPRVIHAVRFSLGSPVVRAVPELAAGTVYENNETKGRATVSEIVAGTKALGGINADFFPFTGDPLGLMVREGQLLSTPWPTRAAFGWGPSGAAMGIAEFEGVLATEDGKRIRIDGVNRECAANEVVLNTPAAGDALAKAPNVTVVLRPEKEGMAPSTLVNAKVDYLLPDALRTPVPAGALLLVAGSARMREVTDLRPDQRVSLGLQTKGLDWERVDHVVGGGPFLVRDGKVAVDWQAQGFNEAFATKRHPRTAVGQTVDGDLWFVAVDGRQRQSAGATLAEMARIMLRLGCTQAINLDGGGSTALNLLGQAMNRPSEGRERPVANAVAFFGPAPVVSDAKLRIMTPASFLTTDSPTLRVVDDKGVERPGAGVLWACTGEAWIDQGGTLRALRKGKATVFALVEGQMLQTDVQIQEPVAPAKDAKPVKSTGKQKRKA